MIKTTLQSLFVFGSTGYVVALVGSYAFNTSTLAGLFGATVLTGCAGFITFILAMGVASIGTKTVKPQAKTIRYFK